MESSEIKQMLLHMLLAEHSKNQMQKIVSYIGNDPAKFDVLLYIFLESERKITQRASWPLSNCAEQHPELVQKHLRQLLTKMNDPQQHPAVRRHVLRIFDLVDIPKALHGRLMDVCINSIESPTEAVAAQAFALGILIKLTEIYPEIRHEIEMIVNSRLPHATAGFRSRAKKYSEAFRRDAAAEP